MTTTTPLPPPVAPPSGAPAILRTVDPGSGSTGPLSSAAALEGDRIVVRAAGPGTVAGQPFSPEAFRDVVIDVVLSLERGGTDDTYGVFLRQVNERTYLAFMVTPDGRCSLLAVGDGASAPITQGWIPPEAPFARGLGAANRLTVIAVGPCVTCIVNGFVVTGAVVDTRYRAGIAGSLVVHLASEPAEAAVALHWAQVRALLADQG